MNAIRLILIVSLVLIVVLFLRNRNAARFAAGKKIVFVLFAAAAVTSVLFPSVFSWLAELVGVGRGADLLFYATVVAFIAFALNTYLRFRDMQNRITQLARRVAIAEAWGRDGEALSSPNEPE